MDGVRDVENDAAQRASDADNNPPEIAWDFEGFERAGGSPRADDGVDVLNIYTKIKRHITAESVHSAPSLSPERYGAGKEEARHLLPHEGGKVTSDWRPKVQKPGLGTFMGVFVPSTLSIVGVVLFMRLGWAVGQAGVLGVVSMYAIGALMCYPTLLSLSAIATNGRVAGGGIYYLLSRTLGPEIGGGIGVLFAIANMCGVAFYMQGFTDTLGDQLNIDPHDPHGRWVKLGYGAALLAFEVVICLVSSNLYARSAFFVFIMQVVAQGFGNIALFARTPFTYEHQSDVTDGLNLTLSLTGPSWQQFQDNLMPEFDDGTTYAAVFGIIFPSLTGIMAGANMSGVLKRPDLAIPRGSLMSLTVALLGYLFLVCSLGACVPRETLKNDYLILSRVTWLPMLVIVGILVSSASSSLTAIQSAARLLQALAEDDIFPFLRPFAGMWRGEPALAILFSSFVALGLMVIGSLDILAPVLTMFFLLTYAFTNFGTLLYKVAGAPNFRPRFRHYNWFTALSGGFLCVGLMFYIEWMSTLVSFFVMVVLGIYVARYNRTKGWGDVTQALMFHQVRKYLLKLSGEQHIKFWRARFLYLCPSPAGRVNRIEFVNHLKKGGLMIVGDVTVDASGGRRSAAKQRGRCEVLQQTVLRRRLWEEFIVEARLKAFVDCVAAATYRSGVRALLMASGLGGMRPNCLIAELPSSGTESRSTSATGSRSASEALKPMNFVFDEKAPKKRRPVHVASDWHAAAGVDRDGSASSDFGTADACPNDGDLLAVLSDASDLDLSLAVMANFEGLDISKIVRGYRARAAHDGTMGFKSSSKKLKERIDVWECPWGSKDDFGFALQLADMLNKQDVWEECTDIRVCSFVEHDDASLTHTRQRYANLHAKVLREMRIPGTIQVWPLTEVWVSLLAEKAQACAASHQGTAKDAAVLAALAVAVAAEEKHGSDGAPPPPVEAPRNFRDVDSDPSVRTMASHLPLADQMEVMKDLIVRSQRAPHNQTALSILPLPPLPTDEREQQVYLHALRQFSTGLGPVLFVWSSTACMTFEL
eukprot:TRINITY_DN15552_c0_g1_i1.p1 TRINITY_DN15552_c0_g1~~TRINITY_DN15552_c0_g1_i1.p1  ORF type:complete len:1043 (+),score=364.58 TRINITY_DN15552_c0_g1_i1:54-3182(+)